MVPTLMSNRRDDTITLLKWKVIIVVGAIQERSIVLWECLPRYLTQIQKASYEDSLEEKNEDIYLESEKSFEAPGITAVF